MPYISVLACLTPSTLQGLINNKVLSTGMSRRCIFIHANHISDPHSFIVVTPEQQKAWDTCVAQARKLENVVGSFTWTPEARAFYSAWYDSFKPTVKSVKSEVLRNFYMTKPEYVIKISMLLSLAKSQPTLVHELEYFKAALDLVTSIEEGAVELFDSTGRNELSPIASNIEKFLRARVGTKVSFGALHKEFWMHLRGGDKRELESIMGFLVSNGKIRQVSETEKNAFGNFQQAVFYIYQP